MAKTSKELLEWEQKQAVEQTVYPTKTIEFFGRKTPIVLQNENGPCPLLAICNILLLRNKLSLSTEVTHVSEGDLLTLVAESLIASLSNDENVQTIADAIDILPLLAKGLNVNVKFTRIDDIEFTRKCAIFDLLDIPLYHGWLIDPQDAETSDAIGSKSYDTLMGDLAGLQILHMEAVSMKNSEEDRVEKEYTGEEHEPLIGSGEDDKASHDRQMHTSEQETEKLDGEYSGSKIRRDGDWVTFETNPDKGSHDGQMNASELEKHESEEGTEKTSIEVEKETEKSEGDCSSPRVWYNDERVAFGQTTSNEACSSAHNIVLDSSIEMTEIKSCPLTARQGELVRDFLENNASQLTVYGLFCLREGLKSRELCVFFRNNHFSTMLKHEGTLYMLVTDLGYIYQPGVVWEKLSEVNGDTVYVNKMFKIYEPEIVPCTWDEESLKRKNDAYLDRIDYTEAGEDLSSDPLLADFKQLVSEAKQSQQQELEENQPRHVSPEPFPTGFIVGPEHNYSVWPRNPPRNPPRSPPKKPSKKDSKGVMDKCKMM